MKKKSKEQYLKVNKTYPVVKTLMRLICKADDFLTYAYNPREDWKTMVIKAQGELERAMQLCESEMKN